MCLYAAIRLAVILAFTAVALGAGRSPISVLSKWDSQWYAGIADNGYGYVRQHPDGRLLADYAFFPLQPMLQRLLSELLGTSTITAGFVISCAASFAAALGIYQLSQRLYGARAALISVALWAVLPSGAIQWMPYTESLFTALAVWSLFEVLAGRWLLAGALGALAGLTRPLGVAVAAAVVIAAIQVARQRPRHAGRTRAAALGSTIACAGPLSYLGWVGWRVGDPLGYFAVTDGWGNSFDGGVAFGEWVEQQIARPPHIGGLALLGGVTLLLWLVAVCFRQRQPAPLLAYLCSVVVMSLTTSSYFGSKPRYLLPAFPLLLPLARWLGRASARQLSILMAAATVGSAWYSTVWLLGPGPP